jgi:hypothetical protein
MFTAPTQHASSSLTIESGVPPSLQSMKPFTSVLFLVGIVIVIDFNKIL